MTTPLHTYRQVSPGTNSERVHRFRDVASLRSLCGAVHIDDTVAPDDDGVHCFNCGRRAKVEAARMAEQDRRRAQSAGDKAGQ
tara:strand:+ start:205 stop:453 length:249 start_codon:yes stop_codon:yes gene_type:complete